MKNRLVRTIAISFSLICVAGFLQSPKGLITSEPAGKTLSKDQLLLNLAGFRQCTVLVEEVPAVLKDSVTRADVTQWVTNRLVNANVKVVSSDEASKAFFEELLKAEDDIAHLRLQDKFSSSVYVNINAVRDSTGQISYGARIEVNRGAFLSPGYFSQVAVWGTGGAGYFGRGLDPKTVMREQINKYMDTFETDWKKCNPR